MCMLRFQFAVDDDIELENGEFLTVKVAHNILSEYLVEF